MPRDPELRLLDIIDHADNVIEQCEGETRQAFAADRRLHQAVLYSLVVIGEAAANLPELLTAAIPTVPWPRVRGFRNLVVHEYFGVQMDEVWRAATQRVPVLRAEVWRVLQERFPEAARRYEEERP